MRENESYVSALSVLERASEQDLSNAFIRAGIINKFHLQMRLALNLLRQTLVDEGNVAVAGTPRDIFLAASGRFDCIDGALWMEMLENHCGAVRIIDDEAEHRLISAVIDVYIPAFQNLARCLEER